jgi:hypothetical protein
MAARLTAEKSFCAMEQGRFVCLAVTVANN